MEGNKHTVAVEVKIVLDYDVAVLVEFVVRIGRVGNPAPSIDVTEKNFFFRRGRRSRRRRRPFGRRSRRQRRIGIRHGIGSRHVSLLWFFDSSNQNRLISTYERKGLYIFFLSLIKPQPPIRKKQVSSSRKNTALKLRNRKVPRAKPKALIGLNRKKCRAQNENETARFIGTRLST